MVLGVFLALSGIATAQTADVKKPTPEQLAARKSVLNTLSNAAPTVRLYSADEIKRVHQGKNMTSCFWTGTLNQKTFNILFPDTGVGYWISQFKLPEGARLDLSGKYPYARYLSFASYNSLGQPVDSLNDRLIEADKGSSNPFLEGASRLNKNRNYTVSLAAKPLEAGVVKVDNATRPRNTLFVPTEKGAQQVWMRIYVTDQGKNMKGGVPLPEPKLTLADGRTLTGAALCDEIVVEEGAVRDFSSTPEATAALSKIPGAKAPYHPAQPNPVPWNTFFNPKLVLGNFLVNTPFEPLRSSFDTTRRNGFYSTLDNSYMVSYVDNRYGDAVVMRGKAPKTPHTFKGDELMSKEVDMRYWSVCKNQSLATGKVDSCLYDEQVPVDGKGDYTIVVSTKEMRPKNARKECGVAWMAWGEGDGIGNPHAGNLIFRHMLPSPNFKNSLASSKVPGDEKATLGDYYPTIGYESKADFEALGCSEK